MIDKGTNCIELPVLESTSRNFKKVYIIDPYTNHEMIGYCDCKIVLILEFDPLLYWRDQKK